MKPFHRKLALAFAGLLATAGTFAANLPAEQDPASFKGVIGMTGADSKADLPPRTAAPKGAPNILVWMLDDTGFAQLGSYGGLSQTATIDRIAQSGLRYNNFQTTALCSSSRASFLTGRNPGAVATETHSAAASGFPGYWARVPKSAATIARILQQNGYTTYALGKWDHLPTEDTSTAGPTTYWPTGQGFDHFYGFLAAEMDQFRPLMWNDQTPVNPAEGRPDYQLTADIADRAIEWITTQKAAAPGRPFFMYWATGAMHSPHQVKQAWIDKYKGKFSMGWDKARELILANQKKLGMVPKDAKLPAPTVDVPAWNSLSAEQKKLAERQMETFAGYLDYADQEFGRIVDTLRTLGELDNTIIVITSDNGASGEAGIAGTHNEMRMSNGMQTGWDTNVKYREVWGGPETHPHYSIGWAMAGNTPFRYFKQLVHFGGIRDPLVISWPRGIKQGGGIRSQFHHISDVMPTLLEAAGIAPPAEVDGVKQQPVDGTSMLYTFDQPEAPTRKEKQYFEMFGNRGIWAGGWKAEVAHNPKPWEIFADRPFDQDVWELYHTDQDFNELHDLAKRNPKKLAEMKQLFDAEAKRNNVYPLRPAPEAMSQVIVLKERLKANQGRFEYAGDTVGRLPALLAPPVLNRSYTINAEIEPAKAGATGIIVAEGGSDAGYSLYLKEGVPVFCYNFFNEEHTYIRGTAPLPAGKATVRFEFARTGPNTGKGTLYVNGQAVGEGVIPHTVPARHSVTETFDIGRDEGSQVSRETPGLSRFPGRVGKVTFDVSLTN